MAAVNFGDGAVNNIGLTAEQDIKVWVSPSTMDSADTVDLPTLTGKTPVIVSAFDDATGNHITATRVGQTITLDAVGGATNSTYVLMYTYR